MSYFFFQRLRFRLSLSNIPYTSPLHVMRSACGSRAPVNRLLVVRRGVRRANRNAKRREERRAETVRDGSLWSFVAKVCLPVS